MHDENRQGFLEPALSRAMRELRIGVVGLSGGGSHIVQALAHLGFLRYALYDPKCLEEKHRHRVVGALGDEFDASVPKVEYAKRLILDLRRNASVEAVQSRWEDRSEPLRLCDVIFGCVDSYTGRHQLEVHARRFGIAYVDIGMDVHAVTGHPPRMSGQAVLSEPGGPCLWCLGVLTEARLSEEARDYDGAGGRAQVVWANGILANAAVGLLVDYVTAWGGEDAPSRLLCLDGNRGALVDSDPRWTYRPKSCPHYPPCAVGDPRPVPLMVEPKQLLSADDPAVVD